MTRDALLALDLGNSALKGARFDGERLVASFRLAADPSTWTDALRAHALPGLRCALASVVPTRTPALVAALEALTGAPPAVVDATSPLPFRMAYDTPETLGADRLAAAAGAHALFGRHDPLVVIDAGTAATVEVLADGTYLGGAIAPGPDLLRRALAQGTAQLPEVPPETPARCIGRSTREALQAGVAAAFVGGLRYLLAATRRELGRRPFVVVTGGWGAALAGPLHADAHEPALVLHGVRVLAGPPA